MLARHPKGPHLKLILDANKEVKTNIFVEFPKNIF